MALHHKEKILIVHNYYQIPGGEDTVVSNEKRLLEEYGHEVILYIRNNNEIKSMSKLQMLTLSLITIFNPRTYREIKKIIREEKIEIVHVHNTFNLISPAVYYAATKMKVPVVQTIHNFRLLCPNATLYRNGHICNDCVNKGLGCAVKHKCYHNSKIQTLICVIGMLIHRMTGIYGKINYICLTEFNKKKLLNLKQINPERVFVKPNFVNEKEIYLPAEKRKDQFVFVGRLDKLKGIDLLLDAWKKVSRSKLLICGIGPMEEWCRHVISKNKLNAEMLGFVENKKVLEIIAESRALILPTQWYEGFPMSIIEAFSVGTPVICTDIGNVGYLIKNGETGWKFTDIDSLITYIRSEDNIYNNVIEEYKKKYTRQENYAKLQVIYKIVKADKHI